MAWHDYLSVAGKEGCLLLESFAALEYIRDKKVLPDFTTLVACCSKPTRDKISRLMTFFFLAMLLAECKF